MLLALLIAILTVCVITGIAGMLVPEPWDVALGGLSTVAGTTAFAACVAIYMTGGTLT